MCPPPPSILANKVDQHPCPQPEEDAHALEEATQLLPHTVVLPYPQSEKLQVFPSLLGGNDMCDGLLVTDGQERLAVSVSSSLHILRRFFPQLPFLSWESLPTPPSYSSSTSPPRPCVSAPSQCKQCSWISVVWRKYRDRVGAVTRISRNNY